MALEIEHKYIVTNDSYRDLSIAKKEIAQGYLSRDKYRTVRVRVKDDSAYITVKGVNDGDTRLEFEYPVPVADAHRLLSLCLPHVISKTRYIVPFEGNIWEVDEFHGDLQGLVVAEIELLDSEQKYTLPPFVGDNVTNDIRYYNSNLSEYGLSQF